MVAHGTRDRSTRDRQMFGWVIPKSHNADAELAMAWRTDDEGS
jgi:hypothetical protein